jgi:hypothetical protein
MNKILTSSGKQLLIRVGTDELPDYALPEIDRRFTEMAPFIKNTKQVLYLGGHEHLGYAPNGKEIYIGFHPTEPSREMFINTISHEFHHHVRWQRYGNGWKTLGDAITTEGIASYYAKRKVGWEHVEWPAWNENPMPMLIREWDSTDYDYENTFHKGQYGDYMGYAIGHKAIQKFYTDHEFSLGESFRLTPDLIKPYVNSGIMAS